MSYRNLKSYLPFVNETMYDRELHLLDRALLFGHEPATFLHTVLGTNVTAHALSYVYLWFLPMVPLGVTAWLVWSRNLSFGYWFVTSQCLAWTLGTASYYALPTLGPGLEYVPLYTDLADTPTSGLMDSPGRGQTGSPAERTRGTGAVRRRLREPALRDHAAAGADGPVHDPLEGREVVVWINFGLTVVATLYFGWHYIADDLGGIVIAMVSFYVGGVASGQKFEAKSLRSHPTTTTSAVPISRD